MKYLQVFYFKTVHMRYTFPCLGTKKGDNVAALFPFYSVA